MRKEWILLVFTCILLGCFHLPLAGGETLHFQGDDRNWIFGGKTKLGETTFIPEGQNAQDWTEAVILNEIPGDNVSLDEYYKGFMSELNNRSGNIFQSKVLKSTPDQIVFEWWIDSSTPGAQHGWIKVTKVKDGLRFFRYTTKDMSKLDDARNRWERVLSTYDVENMDASHLNFNVDFKKDGRDWVQGFKGEGIVEYVVDGQTVENWKELFTIQFYSKLNITLPDYYSAFVEGLQQKVKEKVNSKILEQTDNSILFEWSIESGPEAQHEWVMVKKVDPQLITIMRYTTKNLSEAEKVAPIWIEILKNASTDVTYNYQFINNKEEHHESTSKTGT